MSDRTIANAVNLTVPLTATIAVGASLSGAVEMRGHILTAITVPAATEGTTMTFEASIDGATFYPMYNPSPDGSEFSITIGASRYIPVDQTKFLCVRWLKVRTGTIASPTAQVTEAAIIGLLVIPG